jgi:hypothetical protein
MTALYVLLYLAAFGIYGAVGLLIFATVCRRSRASWRAWSSNLGEFVMSMSLTGLLILATFWPIYLGIGLIITIPSFIRDTIKLRRRRKSHQIASAPDAYFINDLDVNSMYPRPMMDLTDSKTTKD